MPNPLAHSWLKPNIQHLSSGNSGGPINLLTNVRSSQEIPEIITGNQLSTNDKEKKLKAVVPSGCIPKPLSNAKGQNTGASGEPQQAPRRQVSRIDLSCAKKNLTSLQCFPDARLFASLRMKKVQPSRYY